MKKAVITPLERRARSARIGLIEIAGLASDWHNTLSDICQQSDGFVALQG
jgi:hypothetical protein